MKSPAYHRHFEFSEVVALLVASLASARGRDDADPDTKTAIRVAIFR